MNALVEFLLARIAEDEAVAREVIASNVRLYALLEADGDPETGYQLEEANQGAEYMVGVRPSRVLAECEAKRRIVEEHSPNLVGYCPRCRYGNEPVNAPCPTLRALALPYADHPSYREGWKP